ncbi:putative phage terminase large subunit-like protein [Silicimonas algicola]|uniref:Putative phage terminase large subunit-like protein n=2 Tax=Silicimonas algicola TaxID=1826607 RepID=A0A316G4K9_9RHOB|nr:putative phage terminase large subunit-like protein [Silicimonas algicola]
MATNSEMNAVLRQDFPAFVEKVFHTLNPGQEYLHNWHIDAITWLLSCVMNGETKRVMVNVPPRTLKSMIISIAWPAFVLGHDPTMQIFVVSHSLDLAEEHHAAFRTVIESVWYTDAFPTMVPKADKDTALMLKTSEGGFRKAYSVGSKITGLGADIMILDDTLDASDALNEAACAKVNHWIANVLMGRFNKGSEGIIVLVMQRLAMNDPAAFLRQLEPWNMLSLPAKAEVDQSIPIGPDATYQYVKGELLHPELLPAEFLEQRKVAMGTAGYSAQYLQAPLPAGGGYIDVSLFQRHSEFPKVWDARFLSIDAASGSDSGSYSVIQVWQISDGRLYLVASGRGRWSFPNLKKAAIAAFDEFDADFYLIELASSGRALAEELWEYYPREVRRAVVQWFKPTESKEIRMDRAMVAMEDGRVFLPMKASWLQDLIEELQAFPNGEYDDQVDALSQAVWFFAHPYKRSRHNPRNRSRVIGRW